MFAGYAPKSAALAVKNAADTTPSIASAAQKLANTALKSAKKWRLSTPEQSVQVRWLPRLCTTCRVPDPGILFYFASYS
jgi:hypothetical protein